MLEKHGQHGHLGLRLSSLRNVKKGPSSFRSSRGGQLEA
jgi:hypothetical protein